MTTAASGVAGGSATAPLDLALTQTRQAVQQFGGGKRSRKQNRNRQQQNRNRQQQNRNRSNRNRSNRNRQQQNRSRKQKQRGGGHLKPLSLADAIPASGNYTLLTPQELKAAGLNPQWFNENQVNPSFGGALTVPGGK